MDQSDIGDFAIDFCDVDARSRKTPECETEIRQRLRLPPRPQRCMATAAAPATAMAALADFLCLGSCGEKILALPTVFRRFGMFFVLVGSGVVLFWDCA